LRLIKTIVEPKKRGDVIFYCLKKAQSFSRVTFFFIFWLAKKHIHQLLYKMSFSNIEDSVDDPSDFQSKPFQDLDEHLRCPICKEFFDTTLILSTCSHSFCALCIRRSLNTEQNCPKCRKVAYEQNLIHNYDLDHVVSSWRTSR
jgi:rubrerythrin